MTDLVGSNPTPSARQQPGQPPDWNYVPGPLTHRGARPLSLKEQPVALARSARVVLARFHYVLGDD